MRPLALRVIQLANKVEGVLIDEVSRVVDRLLEQRVATISPRLDQDIHQKVEFCRRGPLRSYSNTASAKAKHLDL